VDRDRHGFTEYVQRSSPYLLREAYLLTGDRAAAEDLLQDTYERLYVAWPRVSTPDAYTRRALVNAATSRWRRTRRRLEVPLVEESPTLPAVPASDATTDDRDELVRALATLPARMRAVLVLRFLADLSEAQTAHLLTCSVGTVKSQASRGLVRLRTALDPLTPVLPGRNPA